jgi:hypothetical protein
MQALGTCQQVLSWKGRVGVLGTSRLQSDGRSVKFEPTRTWLEEPGGTRLTSGPVWEVLDAGIRTYLQRFTLDFSPQIESLQRTLPDFLPQRSAAQLQGIIESLRLSSLQVTPAGLDAVISLQVDEAPGATVSAQPLTPAEIEAWESRWQMMDALLVGAVKQYAAATDQPELRAALLEVLIDSRYRLRDALETTPTHAEDPVRAWFLDSWQRLGPVIREIAAEQPGQEWAQLLSVVTATDALEVLDQMGPGVGLDISSDGLRRLARMINGEQGEALLRYTEEIDPELIELWRQGEAADTAPPSSGRGGISLFPRAWAGSDEDRLNTWAPRRDELPDYLPLVQQVLERNASRTLTAQSLNPEREQLFRKLVQATAWQESCWRQYVVEATKLVPLRSGTGDVGLMQINERVWRGFYDIQRLRWDIDYNAGAGAQILMDYLVRYAIKQGEDSRPGGPANLARASYSAYNGGPRQVSRYRRSDVPAELRRVDAAFWEKYQQVDAGRAGQVAACLGGEPVPLSGPAQVRVAPPPEKLVADPVEGPGHVIADVGRSWAHSQPADHVTLQLGAFSNPENAARFIRDERIPAPAYVYPSRRQSQARFLVLYGSFPTSAAAQADAARLGDLQTWARRFADVLD